MEKITILIEYLDFTSFFSSNYMAKLLKYAEITNYPINLEEGKQPPYGSIYSLGLVKLKTLNT